MVVDRAKSWHDGNWGRGRGSRVESSLLFATNYAVTMEARLQ